MSRSSVLNTLPVAHEGDAGYTEWDMGKSKRLDATQLQQQYLKEVFRYVSRRVADREDAEDITAETFAAAFAALPKFRNQSDPKIWLFSIARRNILLSLRRRKSRPQTFNLEMENDGDEGLPFSPEGEAAQNRAGNPQTALEREEAQQMIRKMMGALKEEQCEALRLKYWECLSINEMAVVMKRSPAAVNSLLQRARQTIFEKGQAYFSDNEVTQ